LSKWEKALEKSKESYFKNQIDDNTYFTHGRNLAPKINQYKRAIEILENNSDT